jgi:integrase
MAGLRVSELIGLKWEDVHSDSLTIDERFSGGEWGCPKTAASSATVGVDERLIQRIKRLKDMEVTINWDARGARKTFKLVCSDAPGDLVFQSLVKRGPIVGSQYPVETHQAGCPQAGHRLGELAGSAALVCDLAGRGGR